MADVIGYAGQIIEIITAIYGVYQKVKGLGKEIDDAMAECKIMEVDVGGLKNLFDKNNSSKFPEQVTIITGEFKSLHHSIKKLKKLFKEYQRISKKWYGNLIWAYDKPRQSIIEILSTFGSYRARFMKALQIISEGHHQDQEKQLKKMSEQAKKASEERKKENVELKKKLKALKGSDEQLFKMLRELMAKGEATPENRSKVVEGWLVKEKGMGNEEARSCASNALREGRVPTFKTEEVDKPKKVHKESGANKSSSDEMKTSIRTNKEGRSNTKDSDAKSKRSSELSSREQLGLAKLIPDTPSKDLRSKSKDYHQHDEEETETPKKQGGPSGTKSPKADQWGKEVESPKKERRPSRSELPRPDLKYKAAEAVTKQRRSSRNELPRPDRKEKEKEKSPTPATLKEEPSKPKKNYDKSPSSDTRSVQILGAKDTSKSASPASKPETKESKPPRELKVPVILIQDPSFTTFSLKNTNRNRSHSPSPSRSSHVATSGSVKRTSSTRIKTTNTTRSPSPSPSIYATAGHSKRASTVSPKNKLTSNVYVAQVTKDNLALHSASELALDQTRSPSPSPSRSATAGHSKRASTDSPKNKLTSNVYVAQVTKENLALHSASELALDQYKREKIEAGIRHVKEIEKRMSSHDGWSRRHSHGLSAALEVGEEGGGYGKAHGRSRSRSEIRVCGSW